MVQVGTACQHKAMAVAIALFVNVIVCLAGHLRLTGLPKRPFHTLLQVRFPPPCSACRTCDYTQLQVASR